MKPFLIVEIGDRTAPERVDGPPLAIVIATDHNAAKELFIAKNKAYSLAGIRVAYVTVLVDDPTDEQVCTKNTHYQGECSNHCCNSHV